MRRAGSWRRSTTAAACAFTLGIALVACSDDDTTGAAADASPTTESPYTTDLTGSCPDTVVVQTNWWPEADHGFTYQLLGPNPEIDADQKLVTGPLGGTGVQIEIRAGGPALGFQQVSSILAQNDDILLGYVGTDEAIQNSGTAQTVALFSSYDRNPQVFIWGAGEYDFKEVADIGKTDVTVLAFDGASYLEVFKREGLLKEPQIDTSYQGGPSRFVEAEGKIVQQGFVTNEPYHLENDVEGWKKPVDYILVDEFPVYQSALSIRDDKMEENSDCLTKLIPLFQQAQVDYVAEPGPVNQLLLQIIDEFGPEGFSISEGLLADANSKQIELKLIANGADGVLGSFEQARVQTLIDQLLPVFEEQGTEPKDGLTPADLVTNEFLDDSISLD